MSVIVDHEAVAREWSTAVDVHRRFVAAVTVICEEFREPLLRGRDGAPKLSSSGLDGIFANINNVRATFERVLGVLTSVYGCESEELDFAQICNAIGDSLTELGKTLPKYAQLAAMGRENLRTQASKHSTMEQFLDSKAKHCEQYLSLCELTTDDSSKSMVFCNPLRRLLSIPVSLPIRLHSPILRLFIRVPESDPSHSRLCTLIAKLNEMYWLLRHQFRTGAVQHKLREFASSVGDMSIMSPKSPYREILKKGVVQYTCIRSKKSGGILKRMIRRNIKMVPSASSFKERTVVILNDALAVLDLTAQESMLQAFLEFHKIDFSTSQFEFGGAEVQLAKIMDSKMNGHFFIEGEQGKGFFRSVSKAIDKYSRRVFGRSVKEVVQAQDLLCARPRSMIHRSSSSDDLEGEVVTRSQSVGSLGDRVATRTRSAGASPRGTKRRGSNPSPRRGLFSSLSASSVRFFQKERSDSTSVPLLLEQVMYQLVTCTSVGVVEELFAGEVSGHEWKQLRLRLDSTSPEIRNIQRRSPFTILLILVDYLRMLPVSLLQLSENESSKRKKLERRSASEGDAYRRCFLDYAAELSSHSDSYCLLVLEVIIYSCLQIMNATSLPRDLSTRILAIWLAPAIVHPPSYSMDFVLGDVSHSIDVFLFVLNNAGDFFALCERRKLMRGSLTHSGQLPATLMEILVDDGEGRLWKGVLLEQDSLMRHIAAQYVPELIDTAFNGAGLTSSSCASTSGDEEEEQQWLQEKALVVLSRRAVLDRLAHSPELLDMLYAAVFESDGAVTGFERPGEGGMTSAPGLNAMPSEFLLEPLCRLLTVLVKQDASALNDYFAGAGSMWVKSLMSCIRSSNVVRFILTLANHQRIAKDPRLTAVIERFTTQLLGEMKGVHLPSEDVVDTASSVLRLRPEDWFAEAAHVIATLVRSIKSWNVSVGSEPSSFCTALQSAEVMSTFVNVASTRFNEMGKASCEVACGSLQFLPETRDLIIRLVSDTTHVELLVAYFEDLLQERQKPVEYTIQLVLMLREVIFVYVSSRRYDGGGAAAEDSALLLLREVLPRLCRTIFVYPSYSILHSYLVPLFSFVVSAVGDDNVGDAHRVALRDVLCGDVLPPCAQCVGSAEVRDAALAITCWRIFRFVAQQTRSMEAVLQCTAAAERDLYRKLFSEAAAKELEPRVPKAVPRRQWWVFGLDSAL